MPTIQFKGKQFVQNYHMTVKYHELVPDKEKSLTKKISLDDNLVIHGDNLKALKALLPMYANKVKCIYIDPPYNTGNEKWVYNDNVSSPMMQEWLGKVVDREDLTRHDKWMCMMMPRLKLLRELLRDDGAIFVSIDDNEVHRLRGMMEEVFGENNFAAQITILCNPKGRVLSHGFADTHEYVLCFTNRNHDGDFSAAKPHEQIVKEYTQIDKDGERYRELELRNTHREFNRKTRKNLYYPFFVNPKNQELSIEKKDKWETVFPIWDDGFEGCWTWGQTKAKLEADLLIAQRIKDRWKIFRRDYAKGSRKKPTTVWTFPDVQSDKGQNVFELVMGKRFPHPPKSLGLIERILTIATDENSIILDSFAGSGTTAHAVLSLNKDDDSNRRFIIIECEDYADKITAERVRRVVKGVKGAKDETLRKGLGGSFSYFELGDPIDIENILTGKKLPTYINLARYIFYTATGDEFNEKKVSEKQNFIGESREFEVYLFYKPDLDYLKNTALTLERAQGLGKYKGKPRVVFAPTKYLDQDHLRELHIEFSQLPFEIYRLAE